MRKQTQTEGILKIIFYKMNTYNSYLCNKRNIHKNELLNISIKIYLHEQRTGYLMCNEVFKIVMSKTGTLS